MKAIIIQESISGKQMPPGYRLGEHQASLVMRAAEPKMEELREAWSNGTSQTTIGENFGFRAAEIGFIVNYFDFPPRKRVMKTGVRAVDVDALSDRLWTNIRPKVAVMQYDLLKSPVFEQRLAALVINKIETEDHSASVLLSSAAFHDKIIEIIKEFMG